jgi:hypothetical protein
MLSASLILAASILVGQAEKPSPGYEHLKSLEFLVGDWEVKGALWVDVPGVIPKGSQFVGHGHYEWTWNKSAIQWKWTIDYGKGVVLYAGGTIIWNPGKRQITSVSTNSLGAYGQGVWTFDAQGKDWIVTDKQIDAEGKETSSCVHNVRQDENTIVWQLTNQKADGKELPDTPKYSFTRMKAK